MLAKSSHASLRRCVIHSFYLCIIFICMACVSKPVKNNISLSELEKLKVSMEKRTALSGNGSISIVTKEQNISAPGVLVLQWPNKLRLEVQDPMGATQALLIFNEQQFWWDDTKQNKPVIGPLNHPSLQNIVPIPLSGTSLIGALLGRVDTEVITDQSLRLGEPLSALYTFSNNRVVRVEYESYETVGGLSYPSLIRIVLQVAGTETSRLVWRWSDAQPNGGALPQIFQIPPEGAPKKIYQLAN